jgi:hypothetical protein
VSDEIKVVIFLKGTKGSIGIQSPNCDPVFSVVEGDLPAVLERVPGLVNEARAKWGSNPRYPKCETNLEPPRPAPAAAAAARPTTRSEDPSKPRLL